MRIKHEFTAIIPVTVTGLAKEDSPLVMFEGVSLLVLHNDVVHVTNIVAHQTENPKVSRRVEYFNL